MTTDNTSAPQGDEREGGVEPELGAAVDRMGAAAVAHLSNPSDATLAEMRAAISDYGAGVAGVATVRSNDNLMHALAIFQSQSGKIDALGTKFDTVLQQVKDEHKFLLDAVDMKAVNREVWYQKELARWNKQVDNFAQELNAFPGLVEQALTRVLTEVNRRFDEMGRRVVALEQDFGTFRQEQTAFNEQSSADRQDLRAIINSLPEAEQLTMIRRVQKEVRQLRWMVVMLLIGFGAFAALILYSLLLRSSQ